MQFVKWVLYNYKCQNNVHSLSFWPGIRELIVLLKIFVETLASWRGLTYHFSFECQPINKHLYPSLTMEMISLIKYLKLKWNNSLLIVMRGHDITQDIHRFYGSRNIFFIILIPDFFIDFIWRLYTSKKLVTYWQCVKYVLNTQKKIEEQLKSVRLIDGI